MRQKSKAKKSSLTRPLLNQEQENLIASLAQEAAKNPNGDLVSAIPDPLCAQAFVERLPHDESAIPMLMALKERFPDKPVVKAVRRALFKLKKKGVSTEAFYPPENGASPILKPLTKDPPLCYVGPFNAVAEARAIAVILHRGGKGRDTAFGLISDTKGFLEFFSQTLGKKQAREVVGQFSEEAGPLVETTLDHVATILEEAYQGQISQTAPSVKQYLELRPWLLQHASFLERPIVYDMVPEDWASELVLTRGDVTDLFDDPLMDSWLIEPELIKPFVEEMVRVEESPIILTPLQKAARIQEVQNKCLTDIFPLDKRKRLRYRLQETAYLFLKLGQEKTAKTALAAANAAVQEATALRANPLLEVLLQRSLPVYDEAFAEEDGEHLQGEADEASPLILP